MFYHWYARTLLSDWLRSGRPPHVLTKQRTRKKGHIILLTRQSKAPTVVTSGGSGLPEPENPTGFGPFL